MCRISYIQVTESVCIRNISSLFVHIESLDLLRDLSLCPEEIDIDFFHLRVVSGHVRYSKSICQRFCNMAHATADEQPGEILSRELCKSYVGAMIAERHGMPFGHCELVEHTTK